MPKKSHRGEETTQLRFTDWERDQLRKWFKKYPSRWEYWTDFGHEAMKSLFAKLEHREEFIDAEIINGAELTREFAEFLRSRRRRPPPAP